MLALLILCRCKNERFHSITITNNGHQLMPEALITQSDECWQAASLVPTNTNHASNIICNRIHTAGVAPLKITFEKNGACTFIFSVGNEKNNAGNTVTIYGNSLFHQTTKNENWCSFQATKGTMQLNGKTVILSNADLKHYSGTWRWEKVCFSQMPSEDFLLLTDWNAMAAPAAKGMINKEMVFKFYMARSKSFIPTTF